ncbi:hypothetical protein AgCh_016481 [Apium graveolens]
MTGNKALLSDFVEKVSPEVSYGDGNMGKTLGYGNINLGNVIIETVALVSGLKHNLLSVSQICDRGYHVDFFEKTVKLILRFIALIDEIKDCSWCCKRPCFSPRRKTASHIPRFQSFQRPAGLVYNEESESLTDIFSRFQKLLNALKLHGRVYQTKDSNLKFLRSLPKEWKPMTVSLRNSQDYKEFTLERLYGILKTYELEIEQDERMERGKKKGGSVALVTDLEKEKKVKMEAVESTSKVCENKGKGLVAESEDSLSQDDMEDIDEHLAFFQ